MERIGDPAVFGWHTRHRRWVDAGDGDPAVALLPELRGWVSATADARRAAATDQGGLVTATPSAVAYPRCVTDVEELIRFCGQHEISAAPRGAGHTTMGQSLVADGLVLEMSGLNTIGECTEDHVDVDAGVLWRDLVPELARRGRRVASGLTGYLGLTVGGVLSVGGISTSHRHGAIVDGVTGVEVVTGSGERLWCTQDRNRDLFDVVLAGLGQVGVIVQARISLAPVPRFVRAYRLDYLDPAMMFSDLRALAGRSGVDELYCSVATPTESSPPVYQLFAHHFAYSPHAPDDTALLRGVRPVADAVVEDRTYLEHAMADDTQLEHACSTLGWNHHQKPWFDVFVPDRSVDRFVAEAIGSMGPEDWSPMGFVLVFPHRRDAFERPMLRLPKPDGGEWVFLFDVLNDSDSATPRPDFVERMLDRNRELHRRAVLKGATRYPIGATPFDRAQWQDHYGPMWTILTQAKDRWDPRHVLTPGPGIFPTTGAAVRASALPPG